MYQAAEHEWARELGEAPGRGRRRAPAAQRPCRRQEVDLSLLRVDGHQAGIDEEAPLCARQGGAGDHQVAPREREGNLGAAGRQAGQVLGARRRVAAPREQEPPARAVEGGQELLEDGGADDGAELDAEGLGNLARGQSFVHQNGDVREPRRAQLEVGDPVADLPWVSEAKACSQKPPWIPSEAASSAVRCR